MGWTTNYHVNQWGNLQWDKTTREKNSTGTFRNWSGEFGLTRWSNMYIKKLDISQDPSFSHRLDLVGWENGEKVQKLASETFQYRPVLGSWGSPWELGPCGLPNSLWHIAEGLHQSGNGPKRLGTYKNPHLGAWIIQIGPLEVKLSPKRGFEG